MIKRSFFALSQPQLTYDLIEPDPKEPESVPVPASLTLLLKETIDSGKQALIKKGDSVKKGEKIKLYEDSTAYAVSPVTGSIKLVDSYADDFGSVATLVVVTHDPGKGADADGISLEPEKTGVFAGENLKTLPGAPPFDLLTDDEIKIKTIVVTGADTDLLSTTNQFMVCKYVDEIKTGASILKEISSGASLCITLPEDLNIPIDFGSLQVIKTSSVYPATLPAMVMNDHLGMVPVPGKTPEEQGVCFIRAEALVSLARVFDAKQLGFRKMVTLLDKNGTLNRVSAVIGTPISDIFDHFSITLNDRDRIIIGGPMRGFATYTPQHPVTEDMDMIILQDSSAIPELSDYACVNCGKCIRICPANVPVNLLVRYLEADEYEEAADKFDLESCIECGLCSYVCTARIPLVQFIRLGKHELQSLRAEEV